MDIQINAAGKEDGEEKRWPGLVDEAYPEVFTTIPKQPDELKPGQLPGNKVKQFFEKGYVVIEEFFTPDELEPVKGAVNTLVDNLAHKLYNAGKLRKLHTEYGLYQRLSKIEEEFPGANIILHKTGKLPQAFKEVLSNERILNLMEQLLGTQEIMGHPVWNLRTKTPKNEATVVPWHQDCAYFSTDAYSTLIPTAWIPLIDATKANGCLQVMQGGHRTGKVAEHQCCHGGTWYVMLSEEEMKKTLDVDTEKDCVTTPVPYGGFVLFNNVTPHRSLNNVSNDIRWSIDLRWFEAGKPVGLWQMKDGVLLRSKDSNFKVDWTAFNSVDRQQAAYEYLGQDSSDFDTTVPGPWMRHWEIVHVNRHTDAHMEEIKAGVNTVPIIVG